MYLYRICELGILITAFCQKGESHKIVPYAFKLKPVFQGHTSIHGPPVVSGIATYFS